MKRAASLACALSCTLLLSACAGSGSAPPAGTQVDARRLAAAAVPGKSTRASVLAALGPTRSIAFDSGYEVWLYQSPQGNGLFAEYVILFDRAGVVSKTRQRAPTAAIPKTN